MNTHESRVMQDLSKFLVKVDDSIPNTVTAAGAGTVFTTGFFTGSNVAMIIGILVGLGQLFIMSPKIISTYQEYKAKLFVRKYANKE